MDTSTAVVHPQVDWQHLVCRFVECAQQRADERPVQPTRHSPRYKRSWPLKLHVPTDAGEREVSAALHNASREGLAFLARTRFEPGCQLEVGLFLGDDAAPPIPAVVRHCHYGTGGYLTGVEFILPS